jgi:acyl carrier protein
MADTLTDVRNVLIETLELPRSSEDLDSYGVVALVEALEDRLDSTIDDDESAAERFETVGTVGSLTGFVGAELAARR